MNGGQQINEMSLDVSYKMMNGTMKMCFSDCITDFRKGDVNPAEQECLKACATKSAEAIGVFSVLQDNMRSQTGGQEQQF